jgi:hypothetical protein
MALLNKRTGVPFQRKPGHRPERFVGRHERFIAGYPSAVSEGSQERPPATPPTRPRAARP